MTTTDSRSLSPDTTSSSPRLRAGRPWVTIIILALAGAAFGYTLGKLVKADSLVKLGDSLGARLLVAPAMVLGLLLALAWHELGHLLAGLAQGFRFLLFIVGPLGVRRNENDQVEVYLNRDLHLSGGVAATLPPPGMDHLTRRFAWVVAAGPLASLLGTLLLGGGGYVWLQTLGPDSALLWRWLAWLLVFAGIFSFAFLLATTLPSRTGPFYTDRARFFRLIRGGETTLTEQAALELTAQAYGHIPYRHLNPAAIDRLLTDPDYRLFGLHLATLHHLDRAEWAAAHHHARFMPELAAGQPPTFRGKYLEWACFTTAWIEKNATAAQAIWDTIPAAAHKKPTADTRLTQAALALAHHQPDAASAYLQQARELLPQPARSSAQQLAEQLIDQLNASMVYPQYSPQ